MKMRTDLLGICHDFDQVIRQILRMRCHETDPFQTVDLFNLFQKFCKCHGLLQILTIRVYILSQQHDFHNPIFDQGFNLPYNILCFTAAFPATYIWYNTVAAEIIAAEHNVDSGLEGIFSFIWKIFHDLIRIFPDIDDHPV